MSFSALLTQRCVIHRKTTTKNNYGHTVNEWAVVNSDVPCRIQYAYVTSSKYNQTQGGQTSENEYVGFFEPDTDIQKGDRVTWQSLYLYVKPPNPIFPADNNVHHLEVTMGLQET